MSMSELHQKSPNYEDISQRGAAPTYSKKGEQIRRGAEKNRISLGNERFNIAAEKISTGGKDSADSRGIRHTPWFFNHRYVKLKDVSHEGETKESIYVNVNSLSKRLHLSKQSIRQAAAEGGLEKLIEEKLKTHEKVINSYENIITRYDSSNRILQRKTHITKKTLMKAIRTTVPFFHEETKTESPAQYAEGHIIHATKEDASNPDNLKITIVTKHKLGSGGFGKVMTTVTFDTAKDKTDDLSVTKIPRGYETDIMGRDRYASLIEERKNLERIQNIADRQEVKPKGLLRFTKIISISSNSVYSIPLVGIQQKKYEGNLSAAYERRPDEKLDIMEQTLDGLAFLAQNKIVHKDLKIENILFKEDQTDSKPKIEAAICDVAGALFLDDLNSGKTHKSNDRIWGVHTISSTSGICVDRVTQAYEEDDMKNRDAALLRNDVFSMGLAYYRLFTHGKSPVRRQFFGYANNIRNFDAELLRRNGMSDEMIAVLKKMLDVRGHPNYKAKEAKDDFIEAKKGKDVDKLIR